MAGYIKILVNIWMPIAVKFKESKKKKKRMKKRG